MLLQSMRHFDIFCARRRNLSAGQPNNRSSRPIGLKVGAPQAQRDAAYVACRHAACRDGERDGWRHVRTKGSHRQFQHAGKPGTVTVAGKFGIDVPPGTLNSILESAGLKGS